MNEANRMLDHDVNHAKTFTDERTSWRRLYKTGRLVLYDDQAVMLLGMIGL